MSATIRRTRKHLPVTLLIPLLCLGVAVVWFDLGSSTTASVALLVTGTLLNLLVIATNDGYMPARVNEDELPASKRDLYRPIDGGTRFKLLADWINVAGYLISPGDLLIGAAFGVLVFDDLRYYL